MSKNKRRDKRPVFSGPSGRRKIDKSNANDLWNIVAAGGLPRDAVSSAIGESTKEILRGMSFEEACREFSDGHRVPRDSPVVTKPPRLTPWHRGDKSEYVKYKVPLYSKQTNSKVSAEELAGDIYDVSKLLADRGVVMEKPQGSSIHHMADWLRGVMDYPLYQEMIAARNVPQFENFHSFVVEHDWARAMSKTILDEGDFPMPFDKTCFEFRITGMRVLLYVFGDSSENATAMMFVGINGRWHMNADDFFWRSGRLASHKLNDKGEEPRIHLRGDGPAEKLITLIDAQIKSICVMLDAEVAVKETIRASKSLNRRMVEKGRTPMKDYHVVSLARRHRAAPLPEDHVPEKGAKKRLHFRRGHWRHYADHRTWINWMLVGDETLGFVDKEYRL